MSQSLRKSGLFRQMQARIPKQKGPCRNPFVNQVFSVQRRREEKREIGNWGSQSLRKSGLFRRLIHPGLKPLMKRKKSQSLRKSGLFRQYAGVVVSAPTEEVAIPS